MNEAMQKLREALDEIISATGIDGYVALSANVYRDYLGQNKSDFNVYFSKFSDSVRGETLEEVVKLSKKLSPESVRQKRITELRAELAQLESAA